MSSASPPRTSPTMSRSGRIRSAARTSSRTDTRAHPFGVGRSCLEPHDVRLRQAQLRGFLDGDDALGRRRLARASALHNVVLPAPVAPTTSTFQPARTIASVNLVHVVADPERVQTRHRARRSAGSSGTDRRARAAAGSRATGTRRRGGRRPSVTRDRDVARAARRPARPGGRSRSRRDRSRPLRCGRRARRNARPGPFTMISLTSGSASQRSSGPSPPTESTSASRTRDASAAGHSGASSRSACSRCARNSDRSSARGSNGAASSRRWTESRSARSARSTLTAFARSAAAGPPSCGLPLPSRTTESRAQQLPRRLQDRIRHAGREHPGVDGTRDRRPHRHGRHHRHAQHVADVARAQRPPRFLDQHDPGGVRHRRHSHRAPQREVAGPHDHDRRVGHLDQRFERRCASAPRRRRWSASRARAARRRARRRLRALRPRRRPRRPATT